MASQITNYKCPACTGPLHFAGASGMLECDFCGAKYDVAQIEALYAEKEAKAVAGLAAHGDRPDADRHGPGAQGFLRFRIRRHGHHDVRAGLVVAQVRRDAQHAVIAGREAYLAGRMPRRMYADPSSPLAGLI